MENMKKFYTEKVDNNLRFLLACKLNNFKHPSSVVEEQEILLLADKWLKEHKGEHINLY